MESRKENTSIENVKHSFFSLRSKRPSLETIHEDRAAEQSLLESLQNVVRIRASLEEAISNSEQYERDYLREELTVFGEAVNETEKPFNALRTEYKKTQDKERENHILSLLISASDYINKSHERFTEISNLLKPSLRLG